MLLRPSLLFTMSWPINPVFQFSWPIPACVLEDDDSAIKGAPARQFQNRLIPTTILPVEDHLYESPSALKACSLELASYDIYPRSVPLFRCADCHGPTMRHRVCPVPVPQTFQVSTTHRPFKFCILSRRPQSWRLRLSNRSTLLQAIYDGLS